MVIRDPMLPEGYPDNNPKTQSGVKKVPLHLVPPVAIQHEAMAFKLGADKYGPYNWRTKTVSTSVYIAACLRHIQKYQDGEDLDDESGRHHLGHARACLAVLLDADSIGMLNDDRPTKGASSANIKKLEESVSSNPKGYSRGCIGCGCKEGERHHACCFIGAREAALEISRGYGC